MKVRCISNVTVSQYLTLGKTYDVIKQDGAQYDIAADDSGMSGWFAIYRFEIAAKRVKCVNNYTVPQVLTVGKVYEVIHEGKEYYQVKDDDGIESHYTKNRFEVVSDEVVNPTTQAAPTSPPTPQAPPFDFDKYNGITPRRKVHIP